MALSWTIDSTGIHVPTYDDLVTYFTQQYQSIYGIDVNLGSDSPDGQKMNIDIQAILDLQDLLVQVYNTMDPDQCVGVVLDQRVAINGIQRQAGTFTVTPITLVTDRSLNLYGLDQTDNPVFTVQDNAGNQWQLQTTQVGMAAGTNVLTFQAVNPGAVLTTPNTITSPVTIVLGVTSINNPTTYSTLGINEETDNQLKIRRQQSTAISSQGYLSGLLAALENVSGVTAVYIHENNTASTDGDGVPAHSIWVIVAGSGAAADIAQAIYAKRNAGCGMYGAQSYTITQPDGTSLTISWDIVVSEDLYIQFTASSLDGINPPNIAAIRSGLATLFAPGVNAEVNINQLATLVQQIDPNTLVTSAGFSTSSGGSYTNTLTPAAKNKQFDVQSANTIILPIILNPTAPTVAHGNTIQFSALGGFGTYTYSIHTNNSGGSINSGNGLYTAGSTHPVTDTVRVTDGLGNTTDVNVSVT